MRRALLVLMPLMLLGLGACGDGPRKTQRVKRDIPHVYTTLYPTTYFAERIVGDKAKVICPLPEGQDPIFWKPSPDVIARYQDDADLIVVNGAKLEKWVGRISLPPALICDTLAGEDEQLIRYRSPVKHTHGGEEHTHKDIDGHTWIDPSMAVLQAEAIHKALSSRFPQHKSAYDTGHAALARDLATLDADFKGLGALPAGMWIYAAHPAYAYLARSYGWRFVDLDLDPERVPSAEELETILKKLKFKPGRCLWWERPPAAPVAEAIREKTGLESVVFSPCESRPDKGDYLSVMRANLERTKPAFAK